MTQEINMSKMSGRFTLPGEAGYEELTLKLAKKWGADVIRDSDGTVLSDEILNAGYGIYSTICIIRDHNEWAKNNLDKLQQTFLMTQPVTAVGDTLEIDLLKDFFAEQFRVNDTPDSLKYWQVWDRTSNVLLNRSTWNYADGRVVISGGIVPFHRYTVSFIAYRIWEEISMYNHTTNSWDKEHLMQIDPRYDEARAYLKDWMARWCETHPATTVVRFTSLFYNFVWIWGSSERNRNLFTDWASYDFTVSPKALDDFAEKYGYTLTAEDFINQGKLHVTHMPGNPHKKDWMEFINDFVISFGKELIDIVHQYGKKAYVFYDDSWVGIEPYGGRFPEFGFDGLIKCVFSGYEVRLCAGVDVPTHELRFHPYLFPVGLGGAPTFKEGGNPKRDAQEYWLHVRRAMLRAKIDRIGLGGYLHLTEGFPDFCDYIENISDDFRKISELHQHGKPLTLGPRVAVLHYWGALRSWSLSGHFHETYMHDLIHVNEALSGLPFEVGFINADDVKNGTLESYDLVINAGQAGTAWSGGVMWTDDDLVTKLTEWVYNGGVFLGINEPSAAPGGDTYFRMAHVMGIDQDTGDRICHGKWRPILQPMDGMGRMDFPKKDGIYLTDGNARVIQTNDGRPVFTEYGFGKGKGFYMSGFRMSEHAPRFLQDFILHALGMPLLPDFIPDNPFVECAYFPSDNMLILINNSDKEQHASVHHSHGTTEQRLNPFETLFLNI